MCLLYVFTTLSNYSSPNDNMDNVFRDCITNEIGMYYSFIYLLQCKVCEQLSNWGGGERPTDRQLMCERACVMIYLLFLQARWN